MIVFLTARLVLAFYGFLYRGLLFLFALLVAAQRALILVLESLARVDRLRLLVWLVLDIFVGLVGHLLVGPLQRKPQLMRALSLVELGLVNAVARNLGTACFKTLIYHFCECLLTLGFIVWDAAWIHGVIEDSRPLYTCLRGSSQGIVDAHYFSSVVSLA